LDAGVVVVDGGLFLSSEGDHVAATVVPEVDPWHNNQAKNVFSSSDQQLRFLGVIQLVGVALVGNSAWAISTSVLEPPNMSEDESSNTEELVKEQEAVNARYNMASSDQRKQNEKDSEQLYGVVGEEK
jgi:hypothetical protein